MRFTDDKIAEIIDAADIVELVRRYVDLKRAGGTYRGLCPFHTEKTPSFHVSPQKRFFHCFGCGQGGDAIKFLMLMEQMSFPDAVQDLATRYGVILPERDSDSYKVAENNINKPGMMTVMERASEFYQKLLDESPETQKYLLDRGVKPETWKTFRLGLSPDGWDGLYRFLNRLGFGDKIMADVGLIKPRESGGGYYDTFRGRLMVPVCDPQGRVVAFAGRILTKDANSPKYINSPATPIYKKGQLLYGYHQARPHLRASNLVYLVEGYFDLISMVATGVKTVVAAMGTALTQSQLNLLRGQVDDVILLFDSDEAGQKAAARALPLLLNAELDGRVLKLPEGHDPDTYIRVFGSDALLEDSLHAPSVLDYYVTRLMASHPDTLAGRSRAVSEAKEILKLVPDAARGHLLQLKLAEKLGVERNMLPLSSLSRGNPAPLDAPTPPVRDFEPIAGLLLRHVIIHPECASVLDDLQDVWPRDISRSVYDRLREQLNETGQIKAEDIHLVDGGGLISLISEALLSQREYSAQNSISVAQTLKGKMIKSNLEIEKKRLTKAIREAQAAGDEALMAQLLYEKSALLAGRNMT